MIMTSTPKIKDCFPGSDSFVGKKLEESRKRIESGKAELNPTGFTEDQKGRMFVNVDKVQAEIEKDFAADELKRHGNNPNKRLDECGFPTDRADRNFILNHDFGPHLTFVLQNIKKTWVYIYGDPGRGKTSLAIRSVWEMIKNNPASKASFLSVGKWTDSLMIGKPKYLDINKMREIVVIDDFDKFGKEKDFQIRQLMLLVEKLKERHLVIITANHSREEILKTNQESLDLEVLLDRIRGKSIDMPRFTGESKR